MSPREFSPIAHAIEPAKQGAKRHYGSHPYFTKRAWNVVQEYIKRFTKPGDVVLDPFGGSGVTAVESLVLRRKAIYVDIGAWACFLARQTAIAPSDISRLQRAFGEVEDASRKDIEEIWGMSERELARLEVADWYPSNVPLPSNSDVGAVEDLFTPRMLHGLAKLRAGIMQIRHKASRELLLMAFSATLARINRTFLSTSNRAESRGGSAIFSIYRYKVAKNPIELPLWEQFERRVLRLLDAKRETNTLIGDFYRENDTASFHHGSATNLSPIVAPDSIDYVYTDPPYGAHISYLDLSTMWSAWLELPISPRDRAEEVIEGGELNKSADVYNHLMAKSLSQISIALKSKGWLSLVFAHRDTTYWERIVEACRQNGLEYVNTVVQPVGVVWSMHKKKNPLRVLSGELVLNFQKSGRRLAQSNTRSTASALDLVRACCDRAIVSAIGCTTEELHHAIIPTLLESNLLVEFSREYGDLTPLLKDNYEFEKATGRWHLRDFIANHAGLQPGELAAYLLSRRLRQLAVVDDCLTESEARKHVQSKLEDSKWVTASRVRELLDKVGFTSDGRNWRSPASNGQREFEFSQP